MLTRLQPGQSSQALPLATVCQVHVVAANAAAGELNSSAAASGGGPSADAAGATAEALFAGGTACGGVPRTGMAAALTHRAAPSICNYVEEFIFFSGGFDPNTMESIKTVDIYDVHTDRWSTDAPPLNQARAFHSSCALGNMLYVLCGRQKNRLINSIESIDAQ